MLLLLSRVRSHSCRLWSDRCTRCIFVLYRAMQEEAAQKKAEEVEAKRRQAGSTVAMRASNASAAIVCVELGR